MTCPHCGAPYAIITRTHYAESDGDQLKRDRRCVECGHTFQTVEVLPDAVNPPEPTEAEKSKQRVQMFKAVMFDLSKVNGNGKEKPCHQNT